MSYPSSSYVLTTLKELA
ncbi:Protein of unknown function [Propionibacterium freudenreichii]|nr:Protein of unknown function [Propionibacterium freudenreichii]CEG93268.1 Protein of unknown function [Propionibacterium freudenreichii]CEI47606.1 Protein of unknown function [Propionibacterium freudenreichii]CEI48632.1 Protein of unknown function [Propionibacterium freudenreichii]